MADHADRLFYRESVDFRRARQRDGFAGDLGCPARGIAQQFTAEHEIEIAHIGSRLAVVQRFQFSEFCGVLFDQLGKLPHHAGTLRCR